MKTETLTLRVEPEIREKMEAIAKADKRSMSAKMSIMIEEEYELINKTKK